MDEIKIVRMIEEIGSIAVLRVERWRDKYGHWRAGINWYGRDDYDFIVEKPTLKECLEIILEHRDEWDKKKI